MSAAATVVIGDEEFVVSDHDPLVFGRADATGVIGLDPNDMGISAVAGSVQRDKDLWWVLNLSHKRHLLLDEGAGGAPHRLDCGQRHAVNVAHLSVLVPGIIYTHRIRVNVPVTELARVEVARRSSGTVTADDVWLSERDRDAVVALFCGYLRPFPRQERSPLSYREAANLLGPPWTETSLRRQVDRLKERLVRSGLYFEGAQAKVQLGEYLVDNGVIVQDDLQRLRGTR